MACIPHAAASLPTNTRDPGIHWKTQYSTCVQAGPRATCAPSRDGCTHALGHMLRSHTVTSAEHALDKRDTLLPVEIHSQLQSCNIAADRHEAYGLLLQINPGHTCAPAEVHGSPKPHRGFHRRQLQTAHASTNSIQSGMHGCNMGMQHANKAKMASTVLQETCRKSKAGSLCRPRSSIHCSRGARM